MWCIRRRKHMKFAFWISFSMHCFFLFSSSIAIWMDSRWPHVAIASFHYVNCPQSVRCLSVYFRFALVATSDRHQLCVMCCKVMHRQLLWPIWIVARAVSILEYIATVTVSICKGNTIHCSSTRVATSRKQQQRPKRKKSINKTGGRCMVSDIIETIYTATFTCIYIYLHII